MFVRRIFYFVRKDILRLGKSENTVSSLSRSKARIACMRYFGWFAITVAGIVPLNPYFRQVHCFRASEPEVSEQYDKVLLLF